MLQTKKTKKNLRRKRLLKTFLFLGYILAVSSLVIILWLSHLFPRDFFVSPLSKTGSAASISSILEKKDISYDSIEKKEGYYLVKIKGGGEVLFAINKDLSEQVSSLQLISDRLKIEGKKFRRLDFRYEKTVILF